MVASPPEQRCAGGVIERGVIRFHLIDVDLDVDVDLDLDLQQVFEVVEAALSPQQPRTRPSGSVYVSPTPMPGSLTRKKRRRGDEAVSVAGTMIPLPRLSPPPSSCSTGSPDTFSV